MVEGEEEEEERKGRNTRKIKGYRKIKFPKLP
jgi:hypothetical protein